MESKSKSQGKAKLSPAAAGRIRLKVDQLMDGGAADGGTVRAPADLARSPKKKPKAGIALY